MKKFLFTAALSAASLFTFAQAPTFGIKGGVNFAKINASASLGGTSVSVSTGTLTSFSAGVFADFNIGSQVSIQPAVSFTGKGGKETDTNGDQAQINLYYVQVPVNVVYHIPAWETGSFYFGAGPYIGVGVSGKNKVTSGGTTVSQDIEFGSDEGQFKSTDFGVNGILGFQFTNGFLLGVNYDLGLSNIANSSDASVKNRVFGISAGFKF